jgi:TolB protein
MRRVLSGGCLVLLAALGIGSPAHAELTIEITGAGEHQIPIAVVPFAGEGKQAQSISGVVAADLARSGLFRLVKAGKTPHEPGEVVFGDWAGTDALAIGSVEEQPNGRLAVKFHLLDTVRQTPLLGEQVSATRSQLRSIAHHIADNIYEKLTGSRGVFNTRIAYVNRQGQNYRLVVADSDGYGEQTALSSNETIMSPAWSPDGSHLAYVSFEQHHHAVVYVQSLLTGQRLLLASFPGTNSAPAWAPNGQHLAIVLTRDGSSQIYIVRPDGSGLRRISFSGAIDTEPCFSPDGQFLLFTSDQGGTPQIYRMAVDGNSPPERLTFGEGNNFSPCYSPDGKSFTFTHMVNGQFYVAVQDFATRQMQILTDGGWERRPTFAPNGKIILFANEAQGRGILSTVSSDGRVKERMFPQKGDIQEPTWGPFSNNNLN